MFALQPLELVRVAIPALSIRARISLPIRHLPAKIILNPTPKTAQNILFQVPLASDSQANYYWNFGDGTSGTGQVVTHTFGGKYTVFNVCLTTIVPVPGATGFGECKSISCQSIYNGNDSSMCKAVFSAIPDSSKNTYRFQNQSQKNYSYAYWDFGDGSQSFKVDDVHTYSSPGVYNSMPDSC